MPKVLPLFITDISFSGNIVIRSSVTAASKTSSHYQSASRSHKNSNEDLTFAIKRLQPKKKDTKTEKNHVTPNDLEGKHV